MEIKSTLAGLILTATLAIGVIAPSQAACVDQSQFTGIGWHMVPINSDIRPAETWAQYTSGTYTQPVVGCTGL